MKSLTLSRKWKILKRLGMTKNHMSEKMIKILTEYDITYTGEMCCDLYDTAEEYARAEVEKVVSIINLYTFPDGMIDMEAEELINEIRKL